MSYLVTTVTALLGTLIFTTSAALNTLVGASITLYFVGYLPMFLAHILTAGRNLGREGYFRLPRLWSIALAYINVAAVALQATSLCFPPEHPVTIGTMNWAPLVIVFCISLLIPSWLFYGKDRYNLEIMPVRDNIPIDGVSISASKDSHMRYSTVTRGGKSSNIGVLPKEANSTENPRT